MGKKNEKKEQEKLTPDTAERFNPDVEVGLSDEQVNRRINEKLDNHTKLTVGKSYWDIIRTDVFSFFNILLYIIAILMIIGEYYMGLLFFLILIPNICISLYQDLKARRLMSKLHILNAPHSTVIRNGQEQKIYSNDVVLDDVIQLNAGDPISCDGIILSGSVEVNESAITGESVGLDKTVNDYVLSGSYVISGRCRIKADKVGEYSYIQSVQSDAKKFKRASSEIMKSLNQLFRVIGAVVVVMFIFTMIVYAVQGRMSSWASFKEDLTPFTASMVAMIPMGLYLMSSISFGTGVIALSRKSTMVNDMYSLEMLARVDTLCLDKTGTITDGSMRVMKVIPFKGYSEEDIKQYIANILYATDDENDTAKALREYASLASNAVVEQSLPFTSDNKYSGASFVGEFPTLLMGAPEYLPIRNRDTVIKRLSEYNSLGYRVLVIATSTQKITGKKMDSPCDAVGAVILEDHIRDSAPKTFQWFMDNNVNIKVISGDNAVTVSEIAKKAGVPNADKYISLDGIDDEEELKKIASEYTVFGRVKPDQKRILIEGLKEQGHTVGMTGDGINDILALKAADCSIAMASGSEAAKNASHLVILDSNFDHLPDVVAEGRRSINNLTRTSSLFLCKTMFAFFYTLLFLILLLIFDNEDLLYPFRAENMYIWEFIGIGASSLCISMEKRSDPVEPGFLRNILIKALPGGIIMIAAAGIIFGYGFLIYTDAGTYDYDHITGMITLIISLLSIGLLIYVCVPFSKYRLIVSMSCLGVAIIVIAIVGLVSPANPSNLLGVDFSLIDWRDYLIIVSTIIIFSLLLLVVEYIIRIATGKGKKQTKTKNEQTANS
ncbi:MAG: HAD-IC family P-type ATPase [Coprobacillus sp.]|nr:HAD-IC family P-type ATPase [Coprobacillus sp.]